MTLPSTPADGSPPLDAASSEIRAILAAARRRLWLHVRCSLLQELPDLHLAEHILRVARRTRHADIRLMVDDDLELKRTLPHLARAVGRLTSAVTARVLTPEQDTPASLLLIVDRGSWLHLVQHKGTVGWRSETHDPAGAATAAERFSAAWAVSDEALELRTLSL